MTTPAARRKAVRTTAPIEPATTQAAWPDGIPSHLAITSKWTSPVLELTSSEGRKVRTIDLGSTPLPSNADVAGPFKHTSSLVDFPHWMDVCKAYVAVAFSEVSAHDATSVVINALNHVIRFMAWCVRERIYRLDALNREDLNRFVRALGERGWFDALDIDRRLRDAVLASLSDPDCRARLVIRGDRHVKVDLQGLARQAGIPLTFRELPVGLSETILQAPAGLLDFDQFRRQKTWSQASFENCFRAIGRLHRLPNCLDGLRFTPFQDMKAPGRPEGRTPNLPIEEAGRLFATALTWVYQRAPGVIELVELWHKSVRDASRRYLSDENVITAANAALREAYPAIRDRYGLPDAEINSAMKSAGDARTLSALVQDLQTAVLVLVATNQARRKNEVLGEDRPYGLYRGCVQLADPFVEAYEIDMYIEKTVRDWRSMSCSRLVLDAVNVLERLRDAWRLPLPAGATRPTRDRNDRLFQQPSYKAVLDNDLPSSYRFDLHSQAFFAEAQVDDCFRRTHVFRRLFAMLYMYRFDHPKLQALSEALYHLDLDCTRIYVTDSAMVAEGRRAEELYRRQERDAAPADELDDAAREYRDHQIHQMLNSAEAGGPLTRRAQKWARKIALQVELRDDVRLIEEALREQFERKEYRPLAFPHGVCWASGARHAHRAACGAQGNLQRQRAGVGVCSRCPFHSTSVSFLENLKCEIRRVEAGLEELDGSARDEAQVEIESLRALIEAELALMTASIKMEGTANVD